MHMSYQIWQTHYLRLVFGDLAVNIRQ
uniref:Uncharacterized protein n=1 Tax=Arundo donax TaxID=35708 RepID=A0A0A8YHT6_ARUDO